MKFGLSDRDYQFIKKTLATELGQHPEVKIWCFGSRARGDYQQFSDLDLMIESRDSLAEEIGKLREIFSESSLVISVDLVTLPDFAKSYWDRFLADRVLF